ncbi:porin family protein [Sulfurimonas sp. SAG-AH-194-C21]|nr:porin family protein [Sulfurimonas sp. SAG-AH-194-C21]MDF1883162.1 porin family protein [Sulfurimonas sp. SAG-AH-194-C21]
MKFLLLLISFSVFCTQLNAQRIMITKTSKEHNLSPIKKQLDKLHIKMYYKKVNSSYIVYSQDFLTSDETNLALIKIKKHFSSAYIKKITKKPDLIKESTKSMHTPYDFYISAGLGSSTYSATESTGDTFSIGGSHFFIEGGYYFNEYIFISANYLNISSSGGNMNNFSTAINLNYPITQNLDIYAGLPVGYSSFLLDIEGSTSSTSLTLGALVGISYDILGFIPVSLTYQLISASHVIDYPNNVSVSFTPIQNINLGIGYRF